MDAMIDVRALQKRFGVIDAVNDVSFSVQRGEVLGFLGPNGAGKSTTMKIITGYMPATAGEVFVCGRDVQRDPLHGKRHIGYLPEGAPLYGDMTTASLLAFTASIRKMPAATRQSRIDEVIEALDLGPVLLRRIETLSKGFKRRVGLAQAVLHDPDVLILDEPTDGLDPNQKYQVRKLIRAMGHDKAIIISTHLLEEVDAVCDRAIIIDRGRIVLAGTPAELHAKAADHNALVVRVDNGALAQATRLVKALDVVAEVSPRPDGQGTIALMIRARPGAQTLGPVSIALRDAGVAMLEVRTETGRLDEVFRQFTGQPAQTAASVQ